MKTEEEFDVFYIDLNKLEEQVAEHTFLFVHYSKELKDAKESQAQTKANLDLVSAELSLEIGKNPNIYNLKDKPTAAMVSNTVLTQPEYKKALRIYLNAQDLVNTLQIYVGAFEHRKRMLSEAVTLHGQTYFARPYVASSEIKEVVEQLEKQAARSKTKIGKPSKRKKR